MTGLNKKLVIGVVVGVLVTLGSQWGMLEYQSMKTERKVAAFLQGYDAAKDKKAFVQNYDFTIGDTLNLSTSKAAWSDSELMIGGDGDSSSSLSYDECRIIAKRIYGIRDQWTSLMLDYSWMSDRVLKTDLTWAEVESLIEQLDNLIGDMINKYNKGNCEQTTGKDDRGWDEF